MSGNRTYDAAMASGNSTDVAARAALVAGAAALAHGDDLALGLRTLLDAVARPLGIASAAIVIRDGSGTGLEIVASYGLDAAAAAGLAEAMQRPSHPVTMTFDATKPTYDVAPMNPGGPRLRSHLPLIVTRGRTPRVLGVLALAHDDEIAPRRSRSSEPWPIRRDADRALARGLTRAAVQERDARVAL